MVASDAVQVWLQNGKWIWVREKKCAISDFAALFTWTCIMLISNKLVLIGPSAMVTLYTGRMLDSMEPVSESRQQIFDSIHLKHLDGTVALPVRPCHLALLWASHWPRTGAIASLAQDTACRGGSWVAPLHLYTDTPRFGSPLMSTLPHDSFW